jgi:hypothetical protein
MRNDQIFVLLLVILLPLSGCFDGAVGDAEGTDDTSSGTTVMNNYYNNSTTVIQQTPEIISIGGLIENVTHTGTSIPYYVTTINSSAGELIQLHEANAQQVYNHSSLNWWYTDSTMNIWVQSTCNSSTNEINFLLMGSSGNLDEQEFFPGSAFDCSHQIVIIDGSGSDHLEDISWSLTYSILPTTVG